MAQKKCKPKWIPLFDEKVIELISSHTGKSAIKCVALMLIVLASVSSAASAQEFRHVYSLPTANGDSVPVTSGTGASAPFPPHSEKAIKSQFYYQAPTVNQSAPILRQNNPMRSNMVYSRDRNPNYFTGNRGIPTDFR